MKKSLLFIIILLILSFPLIAKDNDLYEVINELLKSNFNDVDLVILELKKVYLYNKYGKHSTGKSLNKPLDSSDYQNIYKKNFFLKLKKKGLLTSSDANYMFNQIDTMNVYELNSSKINKRSMRYSTIYPVFIQSKFTDSAYKYLAINYKANSFIRFTTPLISKNKMLISIYYFCGSLCGYGRTYLFEKKKGKWKIIFQKVDFLV